MSVHEQLRILHRLFPHSTDLAVSREMAEEYERECVQVLRFSDAPHDDFVRQFPLERYRHIMAQRLPLMYRNCRLCRVEAVQ